MSHTLDAILHIVFSACVAIYIIVIIVQGRTNKKLREDSEYWSRQYMEKHRMNEYLADKIHRLRTKVSHLTNQLNQRQ